MFYEKRGARVRRDQNVMNHAVTIGVGSGSGSLENNVSQDHVVGSHGAQILSDYGVGRNFTENTQSSSKAWPIG